MVMAIEIVVSHADAQGREYTDEQKKHPDDSVFSTFESEHLEEAPTTSLYGKIEINKD